jgi:hypothetical protein
VFDYARDINLARIILTRDMDASESEHMFYIERAQFMVKEQINMATNAFEMLLLLPGLSVGLFTKYFDTSLAERAYNSAE